MKKLTNLELMLVVMRADEELQGKCIRGTTNWAAAIGKAVQNAIANKQPSPTETTEPLDKLEKYLDNTPIATQQELT